MRRNQERLFWVGVFLVLVLAPLFVLLIVPTPSDRGFWRELSAALGYAGLAMVGTQLLLTARIRRLSRPFEIDTLYYFHRQVSIVAGVLLLAHPVLLFVVNPALLRLLNPLAAPWRATAGVLSLLLLVLIISTSIWRVKLRLPYEWWRTLHAVLAVGILVLAFWHILGIDYHLNAPWKRELWITLGAVWLVALLYTRVVKPVMVYTHPYRVERIIEERGRSWTLVLAPEGHRGLHFCPGQFAWLSIWSTPFDLHEHPFSFSGSAEQPEHLHFTIKALGDFTARIGSITPGTRVYVDGPYGGFMLDRYPAPAYVFIAGGIGITPIMSMLRSLADRRDTRPLWLFYANRTWEGVTFRDELAEKAALLELRVIHVLQEAPAGWTGDVGMITREILARELPEDCKEIEYFICGPPPMMDAVERHLLALGVPMEQLHTERFNLV